MIYDRSLLPILLTKCCVVMQVIRFSGCVTQVLVLKITPWGPIDGGVRDPGPSFRKARKNYKIQSGSTFDCIILIHKFRKWGRLKIGHGAR